MEELCLAESIWNLSLANSVTVSLNAELLMKIKKMWMSNSTERCLRCGRLKINRKNVINTSGLRKTVKYYSQRECVIENMLVLSTIYFYQFYLLTEGLTFRRPWQITHTVSAPKEIKKSSRTNFVVLCLKHFYLPTIYLHSLKFLTLWLSPFHSNLPLFVKKK
jgi:hypothetical protein